MRVQVYNQINYRTGTGTGANSNSKSNSNGNGADEDKQPQRFRSSSVWGEKGFSGFELMNDTTSVC